jgi:S1-C subfamily serine protease
VLLDLDGHAIEAGRDLMRAVRDASTGEAVALRILRRGVEKTLEVQLEEPRPLRSRGEVL